ncbi:MAG: TMEM175 family protein [Methanobacteriaceae archaeon]|jgi:uncharacterized membrane protein
MARKSHWENTERIETLVDGIFAIAMTLLVLNLEVPQLVYPVFDSTMQSILIGMVPRLFTYTLSFALLAIFWRINYSQFYHIKQAGNAFLWITVIWLLLVALVPFSTSLTGEYGYLRSAQIFFGLNLVGIGLLSALSWYYVTEKKYIGSELTLKEIHSIRRTNLILPAVSLLAIGVTFISPSWSRLTYAVIPLVKKIMDA